MSSKCHKKLPHLNEFNIKVNIKKYKFYNGNVEFLGYIVDADSVHLTKNKIECIKKASSS